MGNQSDTVTLVTNNSDGKSIILIFRGIGVVGIEGGEY